MNVILASTTLGGKQQRPDGSHLCHNRKCVNTTHVIFESRQHNLRRYGCCNGAAHLCRCPTKRCVWVRNGQWLTCRNDPTKRECAADCELRCFGMYKFSDFPILTFLCVCR